MNKIKLTLVLYENKKVSVSGPEKQQPKTTEKVGFHSEHAKGKFQAIYNEIFIRFSDLSS